MQPTIQEDRRPICLQAIAKDIVVLLGKSHVLEILYLLKKSHSSIRFNELKRKISITSTTLSRRLEELVKVGLLEREAYPEVPIRVEYSLSDKGYELGLILGTLFEWMGENYTFE